MPLVGQPAETPELEVAGRLRIGLTVGRGTTGGIALYGRELHRALASRADVDVVPIGSAAALEHLHLAPIDRVVVPTTNQLGDALYLRYLLGRVLPPLGLDVLHGTRHLLPRRAPCPTVLTVHDLFAFERREEFPVVKRLLMPYWYRRCMGEAGALLCVSDATRDRLERQSASWALKATTVRSAVHTSLLTATAVRPAVAELDDFALVVGDLSPRKNIRLLLRIWPSVFEQTRLRLVIVGSNGWQSDSVLRLLQSLVSQGCVIRRESASDAELRWLYETAQMVLCPSLAEGWGFPVQEALEFGAPVIASRDPGLAEAAAGHAILLGADEPAEWAATISRLARAGKRVTQEREPRDRRTWAQVAEETVAVYRNLIGEEQGDARDVVNSTRTVTS